MMNDLKSKKKNFINRLIKTVCKETAQITNEVFKAHMNKRKCLMLNVSTQISILDLINAEVWIRVRQTSHGKHRITYNNKQWVDVDIMHI